ncbi:hypothetical protein ACU686_39920 [Yinghuangia aomiensis]
MSAEVRETARQALEEARLEVVDLRDRAQARARELVEAAEAKAREIQDAAQLQAPQGGTKKAPARSARPRAKPSTIRAARLRH